MAPVRLAASIVLAATLWSATANPGAACLACISMPSESLSDKVSHADAVALLRAAPSDPFRFAPVGWLKGEPIAEPVPFLVARAIGRQLDADPNAAVVATWSANGGWAIHDFGSVALAETLADLLARDLTTPEARREAFAPLADHADPAVSRMALIELATLPYPILRDASARMDRREVARMVADPAWMEWAPIAIILLGLSADPQDHAFVRRAADLALRSGRSAHLAAWATALIEVDGEAGIDRIVASQFTDPQPSDTDREAAILALATHAARSDDLGAVLRDTLAGLASSHPGVAAALAQIMTEREDWSLAADARQWRDATTDLSAADDFVLTSYILAAEAARTEPAP